jgi:hypothetical protein
LKTQIFQVLGQKTVVLRTTSILTSCVTQAQCPEKDWDSSLASPDQNVLTVTASHPRTVSHLSLQVGVSEATLLTREDLIQEDRLDLESQEDP